MWIATFRLLAAILHQAISLETTPRSELVRAKEAVDPAKQEGVVYRIPCKCGKQYITPTCTEWAKFF